MSSLELFCPMCKLEYEENNPPRLLTMCGHTFCHKCIRQFVMKKKVKYYKIKCPIDNKTIQVEKVTPELFPKNMNIVKILDQKKNLVKENQNNNHDEQNEFLNTSIQLQSKDKKILQQTEEAKETKRNNIENQIGLCPLHNKPFDLFCLQDYSEICTDCVIFGSHRLHRVQSKQNLTIEQNASILELKKIIKMKKQIQRKMSDKQIENEVLDLLDNKKMFIRKELSDFFNRFRQIINETQKQFHEQLQKTTLDVAHRLKDKMGIQKVLNEKFQQWEFQSDKIITDNQIQNHNFSNTLAFTVKNQFHKILIENGSNMLTSMQKDQKTLIENIETEIHEFNLQQFHLSSLKDQIRNFIKIKHLVNEPIRTIHHEIYSDLDKKIQSVSPIKNNEQQFIDVKTKEIEEQQSLLEFDNINYSLVHSEKDMLHSSSLLLQSKIQVISQKKQQKPLKAINKISKTKVQPLKQKVNLRNSMVMQKKDNLQKKMSLSVSRITSNSNLDKKSPNVRKSMHTGSMSKQFSPKYLNLMKQINEDKIDSLDLSNCDFRAEILLNLVKTAEKCKNLKYLKLMRNKLNDSFVEEITPMLMKLERVNLAQNKLSEQCLQNLLCEIRKYKLNMKMKYVNFGQNKVVQRKNNKLVEQFKKLNITLVL